ncbi:MAG: hypothetical protein R3D29_14080 [Nitratireductor sp.]
MTPAEKLAGAEPAAGFRWTGKPGDLKLETDNAGALEGYLSLLAFEREQRRVELLQESVMEKPRASREVIESIRVSPCVKQRQEELRRLEELQRQQREAEAAQG